MHDSVMQMPEPRLENILGATAVAVADAIDDAAERAAGHTGAGPAALTALRHHRGCSIERLAAVLDLSHSGTVRLVDRLEDDGLVRRGPGADARSRSLDLTKEGERRAALVAQARATAAGDFLGALAPAERRTLIGLLEKLVVVGVADWPAVRHRCRLCDVEACHAEGGRCPLDVHMEQPA
jgi:MarR family transcriptional repressor of emrRAB